MGIRGRKKQRGAAILIVISILTMISIVGVSFVYYRQTRLSAGEITRAIAEHGGDVDIVIGEALSRRIGDSRTQPAGRNGTRIVATPAADTNVVLGFVESGDPATSIFTFADPADPIPAGVYVDADDLPDGLGLVSQIADRLDTTCPRDPDCAGAVALIDRYVTNPGVGPRVVVGVPALQPGSLAVFAIER